MHVSPLRSLHSRGSARSRAAGRGESGSAKRKLGSPKDCSNRPRRQKILIVDDEAVLAASTAQILSAQGFAVRTVSSGEEALRLTQTWRPDLILLDVLLPGINGVDTALQLLARDPSLRLLLISGQSAVDGLLREAESQGHYLDLLTKPVAPPDLLARIRRMLSHP